MSRKPAVLDLFCGAGGASMGYHQAGFEVFGIDINPQPEYPFEFRQMDVLAIRSYNFGNRYDLIHASPPCQRFSTITPRPLDHPDLIAPTRSLLINSKLPYVIENVPAAPLLDPVILCGSMFSLKVRRHRKFESNWHIEPLSHKHAEQGQPWGIYGNGGGTDVPRVGGGSRGRKAKQSDFAALMEMPWATPRGIVQAIPPAYTRYVGEQFLLIG